MLYLIKLGYFVFCLNFASPPSAVEAEIPRDESRPFTVLVRGRDNKNLPRLSPLVDGENKEPMPGGVVAGKSPSGPEADKERRMDALKNRE